MRQCQLNEYLFGDFFYFCELLLCCPAAALQHDTADNDASSGTAQHTFLGADLGLGLGGRLGDAAEQLLEQIRHGKCAAQRACV